MDIQTQIHHHSKLQIYIVIAGIVVVLVTALVALLYIVPRMQSQNSGSESATKTAVAGSKTKS